ncbi:Dabb family protein [Hydrogenophaga sp.]|uniref:Dabb family protein n=1 Tax=Hydrogenophaga sp. TaxID=1904254 RepID=UPI003D12D8B7
MLQHIVMWKIKAGADGSSREANIAKARSLLEACAQLVPGIVKFEVATAQPGLECTYDLVLNSSFTDRDALAAYQGHPSHAALKPFMRAVVLERQCMDYET